MTKKRINESNGLEMEMEDTNLDEEVKYEYKPQNGVDYTFLGVLLGSSFLLLNHKYPLYELANNYIVEQIKYFFS